MNGKSSRSIRFIILESVEKYGRVQELKVVMKYNLRTMRPFKDMAQGMKLMRRGVISPWDLLKPGKKDKTASGIFTKVRQAEKGEVGK